MNIFLQDPNAQKRRAKNVQNGRKSAQKRCKRAQIQKTLPLNRKQLLTHFYLYLSEHSDTICREKCETTARKNLWRADFSKTSTFSFTSVNLHFRAETQRHVNLRYFGGPRLDSLFKTSGIQTSSYFCNLMQHDTNDLQQHLDATWRPHCWDWCSSPKE